MPQFDSGAAEQIGRFSEGLLLRLLHMYMESKVRYLWYLEVITIVAKFTAQQPTKAQLLEATITALHQPEVGTR
jgi:hypothetical protein